MRIFLIAITAVFLCCGCAYTQGTFEKAEKITRYQPYPVPVKFYVEAIKLVNSSDKKQCFPEAEASRWKNELLNHYPELFSPTPENALKVRFTLYVSNYAVDVSPVAPLLVLISLPTLGLLPIQNKFTMVSTLTTIIEGKPSSQDTSLKLNCRGNIGILGAILPTRYLLPEQKDHLFTSDDIGAQQNFTVPDHKMKLFLRVFVAQLHRMKTEEIWKLYTSKYSKPTKLLE